MLARLASTFRSCRDLLGPQLHPSGQFLLALRRARTIGLAGLALRRAHKEPQTHALIASAVAIEQMHDLVERGVGDVNFYTMNRVDLVFAVCIMINIRSQDARSPAAA